MISSIAPANVLHLPFSSNRKLCVSVFACIGWPLLAFWLGQKTSPTSQSHVPPTGSSACNGIPHKTPLSLYKGARAPSSSERCPQTPGGGDVRHGHLLTLRALTHSGYLLLFVWGTLEYVPFGYTCTTIFLGIYSVVHYSSCLDCLVLNEHTTLSG